MEEMEGRAGLAVAEAARLRGALANVVSMVAQGRVQEAFQFAERVLAIDLMNNSWDDEGGEESDAFEEDEESD